MRNSPHTSVQPTRVRLINDLAVQNGDYVLYWMQQSQRAVYNHALEYAVVLANKLGQGVVVGFGLMAGYPEANLRHYTFMLEGLQETQTTLARQEIQMVVRLGDPPDVALDLGKKASLIVCDRGYLRHQKKWRKQVARSAGCRVVQVESEVVVPLGVVSQKAEYAARTLRPKIHKHLKDYLIAFKHSRVKKSTLGLKIAGLDLTGIDNIFKKLSLDESVPPVNRFLRGGTSRAERRFSEFLRERFAHYVDHRNQPQTDDISHMSPYLHFGQISSLYLALQIKKAGARFPAAQEAYLEELIVRRELAMNFTEHTPKYDAWAGLPLWARTTLETHKKDARDYTYTRRQLENAETHDNYWNAAMREMRTTGFMHNYMRMYWGKKILEWCNTPQHAFRTALAINNKYFLDGRDPNSYTGVAWVFGMHDRPWPERPIFGKVRYMAASGLEKKCDIRGYIDKVARLEKMI